MAFHTPGEMEELPACSDPCWEPMTSALGKANHRGAPCPRNRPLPKRGGADGSRQLTSACFISFWEREKGDLFCSHTGFVLLSYLGLASGQPKGLHGRSKPLGRAVVLHVGGNPGEAEVTQSSGFSCFLQNQRKSPAGSAGESPPCSNAEVRWQQMGEDPKKVCALPESSLLARSTRQTGYAGLSPSSPGLG